MKYSLKMSEVEYLATMSMVENVLGSVCKTLWRGEDVAPIRKEKDIEPVRKQKDLDPVRKEREKVTPADNDDVASAQAADDYKVEWGSLEVDVPSWLKREDAPSGEDIGRGPFEAIRAPKEEPLPAADAPVAQAQPVPMGGKMLAKGRDVFNDLVKLWLVGYKEEGAAQPDRAEAMRSIANGRNSYKVLAYAKAVGGLTHAVNAALEEWSGGTEAERQALVLDLAGNITQVSSILFPDLSDFYEYKNIFQHEENDDE